MNRWQIRRVCTVWFCVVCCLTASSVCSAVTFVNVAVEAGVDFRYTHGGTGQKFFIETMGPGCAFLDYDGDGGLDIYAVNGHSLKEGAQAQETNHLFRNKGNGTFADVSVAAGVDDRGYGVGVTAADYDNDGDADLFVSNYGPNVLYANSADGSFRDHTALAGVGDSSWGTGCTFLDVDNDGLLDLYVANYLDYTLDEPGKDLTPYVVAAGGDAPRMDLRAYPSPDNFDGAPDILYRNVGDGTFVDVTEKAGVLNPDGKGMGVVSGDYDADGFVDVFVANDQRANFLYRNGGDGTFTDEALLAGVGYSGDGRVEASMGADFGDYDNDGFIDLVVPNFQGEPTSLYRNEGDGMFSYKSSRSGIGRASLTTVGWSTAFFDYNNDGFLDVFVANGHTLDNIELFDASATYPQRNQLFANRHDGTFDDVTDDMGPGLAIAKVSRGAAFGDYDEDGDVDIFVVHSTGAADLLRNDGANHTGHWLHVRAVGVTSNRDGVGAKIEIRTDGMQQLREIKTGSGLYSQNDLRVTFGLGEKTHIELLQVTWPSGVVDRIHELTVDQTIVVIEGEGRIAESRDAE